MYIKDDGLNPTCSLKDRASFLVSAFATKFGIQEIVLASTGNAGSSMAGVGAAAGQKVTLFLPKAAPKPSSSRPFSTAPGCSGWMAPMMMPMTCPLAYTARFGGLNRNTAYNPMTIEGKKTVSLEIVPPTGPDARISSLYPPATVVFLPGFTRASRTYTGWGSADRLPVVYAVQAEGSDALARAFETGVFRREAASTVADSISVDVPRNGFHALRQLKAHGGQVVRVSDENILAAQARLSRSAGLFTEPAGAAAFAGFLEAQPRLPADAVAVVLATGNGLKDTAAAGRSVAIPEKIISSLDEVGNCSFQRSLVSQVDEKRRHV